MAAAPRSRWQRTFRRLFFLAGTASTFYFLATYLLERLNESRLRAVKEKKQKELLKNHFTSLISNISFTLYALLPALRPQISQVFPVEQTSQSLQNFTSGDSSLSNSVSSVDSSRQETTAENFLHLHHNDESDSKPEQAQVTPGSTQSSPKHPGSIDRRHSKSSPKVPSAPGVGESWASEFQRAEGGDSETETESGYMVGGSVGVPETDDGLSSIISQSISLPATDISSNSPSPPSELSQSSSHFHSPSPPHHHLSPPKSKKELWNDLKIQSIARTMTTAYLVPMLYLLTSSQLAILARNTYLKDVKTSITAHGASAEAGEEDEEDGCQTPRRNTSEATLTGLSVDPPKKKKAGWLSSFSIENMGLSDFVESTTSYIPNPTSYLPSTISAYLHSIPLLGSSLGDKNQAELVGEMNLREMERLKKEEEEAAERVFLTYSWWILNVGWKGVAERVSEGVQKVFGSLPLREELTVQDWEQLFKDVRAQVEMDTTSSDETPKLFDFTPNILPTSIPPTTRTPFPRSPTDHSPHLAALFSESLSHLHSADGRYLLEKGISSLTQSILVSLRDQLYSNGEEEKKKRLAHCLPVVSQWGKGVWEGVPDGGVEGLLGVPEFEGFAALVFGDWAGK
ncbi:hypothetical protein L202_00232 [Cryptococcus amylolentus CBS 6039]|uniref:Peroxin-3 n=1 Tax=Cryptococcus amylolentus CBS 6039 TaxID=1295533 RepID=A0A1E3I6Q7_9TREE|nr:hypothetical protein L202_00232 [Cryptococcus amylolentus CBS 6039]ODN84237.1 hypothetical protein L202_00232 [Cryptococcus amylolentus CBS 6039]